VTRKSIAYAAAVAFLLVAAGAVQAAPDSLREISYGPDPLQRLDLMVPAGEGFPTVIFVHGGSLVSGDKADDDYGRVGLPLVAAGIACANVNYRLAPAHLWPAPAEDVAAAIAWVHAHIAGYGGDPGRLFLLGHSSGAMLVALLGSDERYLAAQGMKLADLRGVMPMGSIMWDDDLEQAIAQYGRDSVKTVFDASSDGKMYGDLETYLDHWPIRHVHAGLPPFLFLIAEGEQEHPPVLKTDEKFVENARAAGNRADYRILPGRTHYSAVRKLHEPNDPVFAIVRDFTLQPAGEAGTGEQK
jgi:arylformamidase